MLNYLPAELFIYLKYFYTVFQPKWFPNGLIMAEILFLIIASHTRVGPLNQWGFGESTFPEILLIQVQLTVLNYIRTKEGPFESVKLTKLTH